MHLRSGARYAAEFFGQFTDRHASEAGKGLNWFFSDELEFRVQGLLWSERFADEFRKRKGYDVAAELPALFMDTGPRTPKVRLDYSDVKVSLTEEGFFQPVFDWHQQRGMIYGCDHGGRGRNVVEFGDYFRTQRWNQGPGCDQPGLGGDIIKNKVASSIAHLYLRPRTWLEGYYGSGWGTSTEQLVDATFRNFTMGQNLLTLHGLYYSTHGGWWEWAPPCNHFRMPYWPHMKKFFACTKRLSFLLSQGYHQCDVAIVYPVAPMEAGLGGNESVQTAFSLGEHLYGQGIDFDFIDFESLDRATIEQSELQVSGERYRMLVLPAMRAVRWSTLQKAAEFARAGGLVVALGSLPEASDRAGRDDPQLNTLVRQCFSTDVDTLLTSTPQGAVQSTLDTNNGIGWRRDDRGICARTNEQVAALITQALPRDFDGSDATVQGKHPLVMHRRIGLRDVYAVHGAPASSPCSFRATGKVELWDPWQGTTRLLRVVEQSEQSTRLHMPLTEKDIQLIVFSPGTAQWETSEERSTNRGTAITLDGPWEFELKPTMDNRFGDFRWPPSATLIGAEARRFRYADETTRDPGWEIPESDDSQWPTYTASFGPQFFRLGPFRDDVDTSKLEGQFAQLKQMDPAVPVTVEGKTFRWEPYSFSWRFGIENDPGHQGYHGLKELVHDEFIGLGSLQNTGTGTRYEREEAGSRYYLWTSIVAPADMPASAVCGGMKPASVWLGGSRLAKLPTKIDLRQGSNPVLLRYDGPGRGYFVALTGEAGVSEISEIETFSTSASWIWTTPEDRAATERYFRKAFQLSAVPARTRLRITCDNGYTVYLNGQEIGRGNSWPTVQQYDVTSRLVVGANVLAIAARNDGDFAGLIAELATPEGKSLLATNSNWQCAEGSVAGWRDLDFAAHGWHAAVEISKFENSLWFQHQFGPPRLDDPAESEPTGEPGSLAMRWYHQHERLPFDTRPGEATPAGWYRFVSPPGLCRMTIIARGKVEAWADGRKLEISAGQPRADGCGEIMAILPEPTSQPAVVAIRIQQQRGYYGGTALPEPIALDCGRGEITLGDWSTMGALACYSGGAWYRKSFVLSPEQSSGRLVLDLGNLSSSAEVHINGQIAGIRVAPPWRYDITPYVQPGDNRLEILVLSTLGGHYTTIPTRYPGSQVSGLIGPVKIEFE